MNSPNRIRRLHSRTNASIRLETLHMFQTFPYVSVYRHNPQGVSNKKGPQALMYQTGQ